MPDLTPLAEGAESLTIATEGSEALSSLAEGAETATGLDALTNVVTPAVPAMYPSLDSYPSAAATWPSAGTPEIPGAGLALSSISERTLVLTPLGEA